MFPFLLQLSNRTEDLLHFRLYSLSNILGKISAQPHPTLCIQFLDREDNDKNKTSPLGKQICFTMVWGCAKILPSSTMLARYK